MREYILKRGHFKNIQGQKLLDLVRETFGNAEKEEEKISASFGALERIVVWTDGKKLFIDTNMNTGVSNEIASQTISAFNKFLENATGFNAKQRAKKAKDSAKS
jgi:hypothetical protein